MRADVYQANDGWRWRLRSRNGRIVAESGEAYSSQRKVLDAMARLWQAGRDLTISDALLLAMRAHGR